MRAIRDERGSTTIEMVVLLPVLMLFVWISMGAAMYFYGRTAALAAAQSGAQAAAAQGGTLSECRQAALDVVTAVGDALGDAHVSCTATSTTVTAAVSGSPLSLVPGWSPMITQQVYVPVERLTR